MSNGSGRRTAARALWGIGWVLLLLLSAFVAYAVLVIGGR